MTATLTSYEETTLGERVQGPTLNFPTTQVNVRELIRAHIYEQTRIYNRRLTQLPSSSVEPTVGERTLNASTIVHDKLLTMDVLHPLEWEEQADLAERAFLHNRLFVLVGDRQIKSLDTRIHLTENTEVTFLRLIPLAGG